MNYLLLVEDNLQDRKWARELLERELDICVEYASNGIEALEQLEAAAPLLVISDLHMPEMDGLALVKIMRRRFPTIPVILMASLGSEETAVEALSEGAAEYVRKQHLADELVPTVKNLLQLAACDVSHRQITRFLEYKQLRYKMNSELSLIPALVDQLQQAVTAMQVVSQADRLRLARCLAEAARNAVMHGGALPGSQFEVTAELTPAEARFTFRDQGPGFDRGEFVDPRRSPDRLHAKGKGLNLIHLFMDHVEMNDCGNEMTLIKRRRDSAHPGTDAEVAAISAAE